MPLAEIAYAGSRQRAVVRFMGELGLIDQIDSVAAPGGLLERMGWYHEPAADSYAQAQVQMSFVPVSGSSLFQWDGYTIGAYSGSGPPFTGPTQIWVNTTGLTESQRYQAYLDAINSIPGGT
jgi:hypothetical protein